MTTQMNQTITLSDRKSSAKDRIMESALILFAEKGYSATTTREIVKKAGSSLSMLDLCFGSKEKLYEDIIQYVLSIYVFPTLPLFGEIVKERENGKITKEKAWKYIEVLTRTHLDIVTDPKNYHAIMLLNKELQAKDRFVINLEPALMYTYNFQLLFEDYAGVEKGSGWARILSVQTVTGMFNLMTYPTIIDPFEELSRYLFNEPFDTEKTKEFMYQYHLSAIRSTIEKFSK